MQHVDLVRGLALAVETEVRRATGLGIEVVETRAACAGPDRAVRVQEQGPNDVAAEAAVVGGVVASEEAALLNEGIATSSPTAPPPSSPATTPAAVVCRLRRRSGATGVPGVSGMGGGNIVGPFGSDDRVVDHDDRCR